VYLIGEALEEQDERGQWVKDDDFLLLLNGHHEAIRFTLPWKGTVSWCSIPLYRMRRKRQPCHATSPISDCRAVRWRC
jgi:hypothetical protein